MYFIIVAVCFFASVGGAICGIGGGVIIKPVLDAFGVMGVSAINFLSGCTVLAMTAYSVLRCRMSGSTNVKRGTAFPLALGSMLGGVIGKWVFQMILVNSGNQNLVSFIQGMALLTVTTGTLIYTLLKKHIKTLKIKNTGAVMLIGLFLGLLSSFLGIGGGPVNLVVLYYFFSMETKEAAENSLYIIFFSQMASLMQSITTKTIPDIHAALLVLMIGAGITGGIAGRAVNGKMCNQKVEKLFVGLMMLMIGINIFNIIKFSI